MKQEMKQIKEPKDLGIRIETKENAFWITVQEETTIQIGQLEKALKFQKAILEMAEKKVKFK